LPETPRRSATGRGEEPAIGRVLVLDEIVVRPGLVGAYRASYQTGYMPGAERRGMRLEGAWQSPPGPEYEDVPTTLFYLWSVDGVGGWWAMRMSRRPDGTDERFDKLAWWQEADRMTLHRTRRMLTDQPEVG
jgi:hypothetical protein